MGDQADHSLEAQSKVQTERDRCRRRTIGWPIETDWQDGFNEVSLKQAVRNRPAVVHQWRESPLRSIDVERRSYTDAKVVPHVPYHPRMYSKVGLPRSALHGRNQFQVVGHASSSLKANSKRKANRKVISEIRSRASRMGYQGKYKAEMPTNASLSLSGTGLCLCRRSA
jgi:hypothetical protein